MVVVESCEHNTMSNKTIIPDVYSSLILKVAARVDKHILSYVDVLPEIGIKWGKKPKVIVYLLSDYFTEQVTDFFRRIILTV